MLCNIWLFFSCFKENKSHLKPPKLGCVLALSHYRGSWQDQFKTALGSLGDADCCNKIGPNGPLCANFYGSSFNTHPTY